MTKRKEFGLLAIVGFVAWLFLVTVVPLPHAILGQREAWTLFEPVVVWDSQPFLQDKLVVMGITFVACVLGVPAAAMAIRRLTRKESDS